MRRLLAAGISLLITVLMVVFGARKSGIASAIEGGAFVFVMAFVIAWLGLALVGVPRRAVRPRRRVRQVNR
jgi:hypothetical protein